MYDHLTAFADGGGAGMLRCSGLRGVGRTDTGCALAPGGPALIVWDDVDSLRHVDSSGYVDRIFRPTSQLCEPVLEAR